MIEVKIIGDATKGIQLNQELLHKGYMQGVHYDFKYIKSKYDPINGQLVESKHVIFKFHEGYESLGSWFRLKYI